jgi:ElaB/YqjD/DUF883 family membrane-anchored ribosome-binding protein
MAEQMETETYGNAASGPAVGSSGKLKTQLGEAAETAKDKVDSVREPVADKLRGAADTLRQKGERIPGGAAVAGAAEASASYIESHNAQQMVEDVMTIVKKNPAQSLLVAGVLGFLIARAFRRD